MSISAMKQALDALIWTTGSGDFGEGGQAREGALKCLFPAITTLRQAIAEAEKQEPVAFVSGYTNGECVVMPMNPAVVFSVGTALYNAPVHASDISQERVDETAKDRHDLTCVCGAVWAGEEMVCSPRKREWVGLTDEEVDDIWNRYCDEMGEASINDAEDIARAIEAKLKEKNT